MLNMNILIIILLNLIKVKILLSFNQLYFYDLRVHLEYSYNILMYTFSIHLFNYQIIHLLYN